MEWLILKKYWKHILSVFLILAALVSIGSTIYNWGYTNAKEESAEIDRVKTEIQKQQTLAIEKLSLDVMNMSTKATEQSEANLSKILATVKNKPLFTIVDGKCEFTKDFQRTYIQLLEEGNK